MPPRALSRYTFSTATKDDAGALILSEPEPYRFRSFDDTIHHRVVEGDTLWGLADRYYGAVERGAGLWWIIADFQPDPIHDPTLALDPGRIIYVPSLRTVREEILSEKRRILV